MELYGNAKRQMNFRILYYMLWSYVSLLVSFVEEYEAGPRYRLSDSVSQNINFYTANFQHKEIKWNQINRTGLLMLKDLYEGTIECLDNSCFSCYLHRRWRSVCVLSKTFRQNNITRIVSALLPSLSSIFKACSSNVCSAYLNICFIVIVIFIRFKLFKSFNTDSLFRSSGQAWVWSNNSTTDAESVWQ